MNFRNIVITLDSPERDLDFTLSLAESLSNSSLSVNIYIALTGSDIIYLASQLRDCLVLLNYSRPINQWLLNRLRSMGCYLFVYDTEGCPLWLFSPSSPFKQDNYHYIDHVFLWGPVQAAIFNAKVRGISSSVAGSFRLQNIKNRPYGDISQSRKCLLIITSSPIPFPKYSSIDNTISNIISTASIDYDEAYSVLNFQNSQRSKLLENFSLLASYFDEICIRVHPFEDPTVYTDLTDQYDHVSLSNSSLDIDITNATHVLHSYSTAGIEASEAGRLSFVFDNDTLIPPYLSAYLDLISCSSFILDSSSSNKSLLHDISIADQSRRPNSSDVLDMFYGLQNSAVSHISDVIINYSVRRRNTILRPLVTKLFWNFLSKIRLFLSCFVPISVPLPNPLKSRSLDQLLVSSDPSLVRLQRHCAPGIFVVTRSSAP